MPQIRMFSIKQKFPRNIKQTTNLVYHALIIKKFTTNVFVQSYDRYCNLLDSKQVKSDDTRLEGTKAKRLVSDIETRSLLNSLGGCK